VLLRRLTLALPGWLTPLSWVLLAVALVVHALQLAPAWESVQKGQHARDFASYHYAVHAAAQDLDPYDKEVLGQLARDEGTRKTVHPYFYPPPFLLGMAWVLPLDLGTAYQAWFWLDSLFLLLALGALMLWQRGPPTVLAAAALLAFMTPLVNNHIMGQANLPVLALVCWGMLAWRRDRAVLAGVLVGIACMWKMSPGLLVAWWLLRRDWRPAAVACVTALVLSLMTLPLLDLSGQVLFYRDVLPGFGSGDYHGLTVDIGLFGNHSLPNLWAQIWPAKHALSGPAQIASTLTNLFVVGASFYVLRGDLDEVGALAGLGLLSVVMIVVPVYAYEHHVVSAGVAWVAVAWGLASRRLRWPWLLALVPAFVVQAWPIAGWKSLALAQGPALQLLMQEGKFLALVALGLACGVAASLRTPRSSEGPSATP
jgi:hypothetical protein